MHFTPKRVQDMIEGNVPDFASGSSAFLLQFVRNLQDVTIGNPPFNTGIEKPDTTNAGSPQDTPNDD